MWGAEHLHGDEDLRHDGQIFPGEDIYACAGCGAEYPEVMLGAKEGLLKVWGERYCPACRENFTCKQCGEWDQHVDRAKGKSVCEYFLADELPNVVDSPAA